VTTPINEAAIIAEDATLAATNPDQQPAGKSLGNLIDEAKSLALAAMQNRQIEIKADNTALTFEGNASLDNRIVALFEMFTKTLATVKQSTPSVIDVHQPPPVVVYDLELYNQLESLMTARFDAIANEVRDMVVNVNIPNPNEALIKRFADAIETLAVQQPPVVNITPPAVENKNEITVQAAPAQVEIMPVVEQNGVEVTEIERDAQGNMTRTIKTTKKA